MGSACRSLIFAFLRSGDLDESATVSVADWAYSSFSVNQGGIGMNTYKVFMQRVQANAGPSANFSFQVQAVTSQMAKVTAEAQYPGYRCINSPVRVI